MKPSTATGIPLLKEILRSPDVPKHGRIIAREAVRGIIIRGSELLLIHATCQGEYKFPGGGCEPGESHSETLAREIREECGGVLTRSGPPFGYVIEYDHAAEPEADIFRMASYYYLCQVEPQLRPQLLDPYETELGFQPIWIDLQLAIDHNHNLLAATPRPSGMPWLERETFVLEQIQQRFAQLQEIFLSKE